MYIHNENYEKLNIFKIYGISFNLRILQKKTIINENTILDSTMQLLNLKKVCESMQNKS